MTEEHAEDHATAESLLAAAIEIDDQSQRDRFIAERCGADVALRSVVEQLVSDYLAAGDLLEAPVLAVESSHSISGLYDPDSVIGGYRLREKIGEGGMGVVFVADQTTPIKRRVALKLIKPGMDSKQVIGRFEAERQALAMMDHPSIAKILDAGTTDRGHPYFVMELVRGTKISKFCLEKKLSRDEILRLFVDVCSAVEHAHQKGLIHRDLKPSNILVTMHDDKPVPKIIDFGVAKAIGQPLTDRSVYTGFLQLVGTPIYMSPEQLDRNDLGIDTRSDVYSLGVVLYEMLTGVLPFDRKAFDSWDVDEMRRLVCETAPPRPSERQSTLAANQDPTQRQIQRADLRIPTAASLRGEVDWIVMKAMEKDRTRRYQSTREFSQDVNRFLNGEPILARPPSLSYRFSKILKQHRLALFAATAVTVAMIVGSGVALWQASVATIEAERAGKAELAANQALRDAQTQTGLAKESARRADLATKREAELRTIAERSLYVKDLRYLQNNLSEGRHHDALPLLVNHVHRDPDKDIRRWDWHYLMSLASQSEKEWPAHDDAAFAVACHPSDNRVATAGADATTKIWNSETGELLHTFVDGERVRTCVDWDDSGSQLAFATQSAPALVKVWDATTNQTKKIFDYDRSFWTVRFSHNGERLIAGGITTSDAAKTPGENLFLFRKLDGRWSVAEKRILDGMNITSAEWSHDDRWLSVASRDGEPRLGIVSGEDLEVEKTMELPDRPHVAHWHPAKPLLAVGGRKGTCMIVDPETQSVHTLPASHTARVEQISWSPDGSYIASCGINGTIHVFNVEQNRVAATYAAHQIAAKGVSWFADSKRLASVGEDGFLRIWQRELHLPNQSRQLGIFAKKADHSTLESISGDDVKAFWRSRIAQVAAPQPELSPDVPPSVPGQTPLESSHNVQLRLIDSNAAMRFTETEAKRVIEVFNRESANQPVIRIEQFAEDIKGLPRKAAFQPGFAVRLMRHPHLNLYVFAFVELGQVWFLDPATGKTEVLDDHSSQCIHQLDWSPSGDQLVVLSSGLLGTEEMSSRPYVHVYDVAERRLIGSHACDYGTQRFAWHPEGNQCLLGHERGTVSVCDWTQFGYRMIRTFKIHATTAQSLCWHPSGGLIASAAEGEVCVWDPATGDVTIKLAYPDWMTRLEFSSDGQQLVGVTSEGELMTWDASSGYRYANSRELEVRVLREWERQFMKMLGERNVDSAMAWASDIEGIDTCAGWNTMGHIAVLHYVAGDTDRFRKTCQRMINEYRNSQNPIIQQFVAWICAIAPGAVSDYLPIVEMARKPLLAGHSDNSTFNVTLGAILVRAGKYQEARTTLESVETSNQISLSPAYRDYFHALACHALGDKMSARKSLESATKQTDLELAGNTSWVREQTLGLLRAECEQQFKLSR